MMCTATLTGLLVLTPLVYMSVEPASTPSQTAAQLEAARLREAQLERLRLRAKARAAEDETTFTPDQLAEIEALYESNRAMGIVMDVRRRAVALETLVRTYPQSNRAGCAVIELAKMAKGEARHRLFEQARDRHADAWFDNGAQVGAVALAYLALDLASADRLADAERIAAEIVRRYPDAVDTTGHPLEDVLVGLRLLRSRDRL